MDSSDRVPDDRSDSRLRFGRFLLDKEHNVLWRDGRVLALGPKVVHTLAVLVSRRDQIVSKEELMREVWGDTIVDENSLAQNIHILRKTLNGDHSRAFTLGTIPRRGYRFCAAGESEHTKKEPGHVIKESSDDPLTGKPSSSVLSFNLEKKSREWQIRLALALAVILALAGVIMRLPAYRSLRGRPSVAVMGFADLSHQPDSSWLSPALSEMIATELGAGGGVLTIPEESVARARTELKLNSENQFSADTLKRLRQNLNADVVVSGAYAVLQGKDSQVGDSQLRLDVRIQDAATGETLATVTETGEPSSLFELVARAGTRIRRDLGVKAVTPQQAAQARSSVSSKPEAVRHYAEGLDKLRSFDTRGAKELLEKAVRTDPNYAAAHAALSEALSDLGYERSSQEEAKIAFELSRPLSPEEQLSIEGRYQMSRSNWQRATEIYKQLRGWFPDSIDYGLQLASAQIKASKARDALETLKILHRLPQPAGDDPRISLKEYQAWQSVGDFSHMENALEAAADSAKRRGALLLIARSRIRQCWVQQYLAEQQQALDNCQEAHEIYSTLGERRGEAESLRLLGQIVSTSDVSAGTHYLEQALAIDRQIGSLEEQAGVMTVLATVQSGQGDHRGAKKFYEQVLTISQEAGDTLVATGMMNNLAGELKALGQIEQARKLYQDTLKAARKIGNEYLAATVEYNAGELEQSQGELDAAERSYRGAFAIFQGIGIRKYDIIINKNLGEIATLRGELANARALYQQALAMHQAAQQKFEAAEAEMDLDQISLEVGQSTVDVESSLRRAFEEFRKAGPTDYNGAANDQALSLALLARCLFSEGKRDSALKTAEQAVALSAKAEPPVRLSVAVTAARVRSEIEGNGRSAEVIESLNRTIADAHKHHYLGVELEARLALGEVEVKSGAIDRGRTHVRSVETIASQNGFGLLANKAKASLSSNPRYRF